MNINRKTFIDIEKYTLITALLYYVFCVFIYKSMSYGLVFVFTACFINLFHEKFFAGRLKLAALNHLLPLLAALVTYGYAMEKADHGSRLLVFIVIVCLSLIPFSLLITSKALETPSRKKNILILKIRIIVQVTFFTIYTAASAYTWICGAKTELFFWGMVNVFTVALIPFLFGRGICGWICPNATMQDGLYKHLNHKRPIEKLPESIEAQSKTCAMNISGKIDKSAPYLPFTLLLMWFPMFFLETVFDLTPKMWYATSFLYGLVILSILFPWRKFCTYFCWFSSYRTLVAHNSIWRIHFNKQNCKNWKICLAEKDCPFHIDIRNQEHEMPASCCLCFNCMNACPHSGVITFRAPKTLKALNPQANSK